MSARNLDSPETRKGSIVKFGLMVIPPITWALSFALPFLLYQGTLILEEGVRGSWVRVALIPSLIMTVVMAVVCVGVWVAYKKMVIEKAV